MHYFSLFFFCLILIPNTVARLDLTWLILILAVCCLARCLLSTTLRMTDIIDSGLLNNLRTNWYSPIQIRSGTKRDTITQSPFPQFITSDSAHCHGLHQSLTCFVIVARQRGGEGVSKLFGRRGGGSCCPLLRRNSLHGVCGSVPLEHVGWRRHLYRLKSHW